MFKVGDVVTTKPFDATSSGATVQGAIIVVDESRKFGYRIQVDQKATPYTQSQIQRSAAELTLVTTIYEPKVGDRVSFKGQGNYTRQTYEGTVEGPPTSGKFPIGVDMKHKEYPAIHASHRHRVHRLASELTLVKAAAPEPTDVELATQFREAMGKASDLNDALTARGYIIQSEANNWRVFTISRTVVTKPSATQTITTKVDL